MKRKKILALFLLILVLAALIISTPYFAKEKTNYFSAYGACRYIAMHTKGYHVWRYIKTTPKFLTAKVEFTDRVNTLSCHAIGIGPIWLPGMVWTTLVGCIEPSTGGAIQMCPEGYFGVSP